MTKPRVILTDIEGTTSSISFVKDVLFPYAAEHLESYLEQNESSPEVQKILADLANFETGLPRQHKVLPRNDAVTLLKQWIKLDLKHKALKDLQGLIWEAGYKQGDYQGHIYDDAYEQLKAWHEQGIKLYIYSSGSVHAQKLLFEHTKYGDLNPLFSGNYDTGVGHKREAKSYINIYESIREQIPELEPAEIVFLTDIAEEADAAREACLETRLITRENGDNFDTLQLSP
ncbi:MAG: acireductone synthase [Candidatus Melainabacteria bacterium]|nr:acireductone synthase [Candidatus Melainabacteria bacterium]